MSPPRIVVTGFEPFGRAGENPTLRVLERLGTMRNVPGDLTLIGLPVDSARIAAVVDRVLDETKPDLWIGLGLAMGSAVIAVERIAVNVLDFSIPDNAGRRCGGESIFAEGPAAYRATLPVLPIVADLGRRGIPAKVSNSASTFLCNQMIYTLLHLIDVKGLSTLAGFLHVPAHPALAAQSDHALSDMPSMSVDLVAQATLSAIETSLRL